MMVFLRLPLLPLFFILCGVLASTSAAAQQMTLAPSHALSCLARKDGRDDKLEYPKEALGRKDGGVVEAEMTFAAPDRAPRVKTLNHTGNTELEQYVGELRMPCQHGAPVRSRILFDFRLIDGARTFLRDLTLKQFVGAARDVPSPVYFDLNTMGCPFDLRVRYMRPHEKNAVSELDTANPVRKPFIDWLSNVTLNVSDAQLGQILGDSFTLTVPCGSVNL